MAKGSHATWAGVPSDKRVCAGGCGQPVRITKDTLWVQLHPEVRVWHWNCKGGTVK